MLRYRASEIYSLTKKVASRSGSHYVMVVGGRSQGRDIFIKSEYMEVWHGGIPNMVV